MRGREGGIERGKWEGREKERMNDILYIFKALFARGEYFHMIYLPRY